MFAEEAYKDYNIFVVDVNTIHLSQMIAIYRRKRKNK